ncbi:ribonuclease H-like domain-containing protein, partial [Tanacetum coccineum]
MAKKLLALIRQRLNVTTVTGEVTLLENRGHQGIRRNRNRDVPRIIVPVETTANALVVQDGIGGYDWSFQAEEGATDFSLMAHLSSGSSSSSSSNSEVRDNSITKLKNKLAEALREKDDLKLKLEKFETSSKKLTDLLNSQISVDNKIGIGFYSQMTKNELHDIHKNNSEVFVKGYHAVPPLYTGNYMPLRPDLSFAALDDSVYKTIMSETITSVPRNESTASMFSKDNLEQPKYVRPSAPITNRQAENLRKCQSPRVDKRNWNGLMTQKLGDGFGFNKKAFFVCGSLNHLIKDCNFYENKMVGKSMLNNMGRVTVLTKSGNVPVNTAKQSSSRAVVSNSIVRYVNTAATRPTMNDAKPKKVNTAKVNNVTTAGTKAVVSAVQGHEENSVKSSACWIWRPTGKGNPQYALHDQGIFNSGFSRHMTRNKSYLTDYQDIDGGFVAFAGRKFNLFYVSQTGDKKNSVLFTETECLILSPDFKLLDESQVLLKVPRQNNMYNFNLKNVVPSGEGKAAQSLLCDNGTEFKNSDMNQFYELKGIKREFSVARTPQQNEVAERKNRTLIEAARTMLANSQLPTTFWAEAINIACYVQNRVLITKPHNKTPYELLIGRSLNLDFMRPFGCHVTILNTLNHLGKFERKADEGFLVGYFVNSKAFR